MSEQKKIYVIGHRNPDTDSICSAISYANLKRSLGFDNVVAARAGSINKETKYALEYFGMQAPQLVSDVYPRVSDVAMNVTAKLSPSDSLRTLGMKACALCLLSMLIINCSASPVSATLLRLISRKSRSTALRLPAFLSKMWKKSSKLTCSFRAMKMLRSRMKSRL